MNNGSGALVAKLWNFCNLLKDDGVSYSDYVQQLTNLLFLKMAYERTLPPYNRASAVPEEFGWPTLLALGRGRGWKSTTGTRWKNSARSRGC